MREQKPIIGILGGMGSYATSRFYNAILNIATKDFGVLLNADFPHLIVDNIPVDDLINNTDDVMRTVANIQKEAEKLSQFGCDFICMPCNTMHLYQEEIVQSIDTETIFISMVDNVSQIINSSGHNKIGLLGTRTTLDSGLYDRRIDANIGIIKPNNYEIDQLVIIINNIISNQNNEQDEEHLANIINRMMTLGATSILLGCTELPLIRHKLSLDNNTTFFDPIDILARKVCTIVYKES